jgi:hypothetical protein
MLTVFWDSQAPIPEHYQERGVTINSAEAGDSKYIRQGQLPQGVVSLHDHARPHTAANTVQTHQQLHFEVPEHSPCSPGLVPADYHLFQSLKTL